VKDGEQRAASSERKKTANSELRIANGKDGESRVASGERSKTANSEWRMEKTANGEWEKQRIANCEWRMGLVQVGAGPRPALAPIRRIRRGRSGAAPLPAAPQRWEMAIREWKKTGE
jgi:hypothetical protein